MLNKSYYHFLIEELKRKMDLKLKPAATETKRPESKKLKSTQSTNDTTNKPDIDPKDKQASKAKPEKLSVKTPAYEEVDLFASLRTEEPVKKPLKRKLSKKLQEDTTAKTTDDGGNRKISTGFITRYLD